jgi:hypothetical protein
VSKDRWFVWMRGHLPTDGNGKPTAQALFVHKLELSELDLNLHALEIKYADKVPKP